MTPRTRLVLLASIVAASSLTQFHLAHRYFGFLGGDDVEVLGEAFRVATGLPYYAWEIRNLFVPHAVVAPLIACALQMVISDKRNPVCTAVRMKA